MVRAPIPQSPRLASADKPLQDPAEDCLGYAPFARALARALAHECPPEGLVVSINGAWGLGKTTALNFLLHFLGEESPDDQPLIVQFNPWWFSGQEDLTRRFFDAFQAAVFAGHATKEKLKKKLRKYSSVVTTGLNQLSSTVAKMGAEAIKKTSESRVVDLAGLKQDVVRELSGTSMKIIVVVDDIDRLAPEEIRQVFKLIKGVADFPSVTYVLAFDRNLVAQALSTIHPESGLDYLEKIVQMPFELPQPDREQLRSLFFGAAARASIVPEEQGQLADFVTRYQFCVEPFVSKPRDVVRLLNTLSVTYRSVSEEVNAGDFVALEALRLFAPAIYETIRDNRGRFAGPHPGHQSQRAAEEENAFHEAWIRRHGAKYPHAVSAVQALFPRVGGVSQTLEEVMRWRHERRVCSASFTSVYFRLQVTPSLMSRAEIQSFFAHANSPEQFAQALMGLAEEKSADFSSRLGFFFDSLYDELRFGATLNEGRAEIVQALCNIGDNLVGRQNPLTSWYRGTDHQLSYILETALGGMAVDDRRSVLELVFGVGEALGLLFILLYTLGTQHGRYESGHATFNPLITPSTLDDLERLFVTRVQKCAADGGLLAHPRFLLLLEGWRKTTDGAPPKQWSESVLAGDDVVKWLSRFVECAVEMGTGEAAGFRINFQAMSVYCDIERLPQRLEAFTKTPGRDPNELALASCVLDRLRALATGKLTREDL